MNAEIKFPAPMPEATRERLIELYAEILASDPDRYCRCHAHARMAELIGQRSPETVERMEVERGLR